MELFTTGMCSARARSTNVTRHTRSTCISHTCFFYFFFFFYRCTLDTDERFPIAGADQIFGAHVRNVSGVSVGQDLTVEKNGSGN